MGEVTEDEAIEDEEVDGWFVGFTRLDTAAKLRSGRSVSPPPVLPALLVEDEAMFEEEVAVAVVGLYELGDGDGRLAPNGDVTIDEILLFELGTKLLLFKGSMLEGL